MAYVTSKCFDTLRFHDLKGAELDSGDSDVEFVSCQTTKVLRFDPIRDAVAQELCVRLGVQRKDSPTNFTAPGDLGDPCKTLTIQGDGNCFFRAVSEAVCGTEEYHGAVRDAVVKQLRNNAADYRSILRAGDGSVSEYLDTSAMASLGSWASEVEIQATADCLGVSIFTFCTDRWLEYSCSGVKVSDQGVYLENRGYHYETVVCVKRPQTQSCYGRCAVDTAVSGRYDDRMSDDGNYYYCEEDHYQYMQEDEDEDEDEEEEEEEDDDEDEEEDEEDMGASEAELYGDIFNIWDHEMDPAVVEAEEKVPREQLMMSKLSWSLLNRSWHSFLECIGQRWWGSVPEALVRAFLDTPTIGAGQIVLAAPFSGTPGGVCSVTVKTSYAVLIYAVFTRGASYECDKLPRGGFQSPIAVVRELGRLLGMEVGEEQLLARPPDMMPCAAEYLSVTHITQEIHLVVVDLLKRAWWGSSRGSSKKSPEYGEVMRRLRTWPTQHKDPAAVIHFMDCDSCGYLFDIVTARGRRFQVTFDRLGFRLGPDRHFSELTSVLVYICKVKKVYFMSRPWYAM